MQSNARQNGRDLFSARRGLLAALRRIYNSGADAGNPILAKSRYSHALLVTCMKERQFSRRRESGRSRSHPSRFRNNG
jgi:hypothetical protein